MVVYVVLQWGEDLVFTSAQWLLLSDPLVFLRRTPGKRNRSATRTAIP
jgi:hypothetical protein